jgi:hypothetical protein
MNEHGAARRIRENPFYVLGVRPHASRQEIEREGQKLLGMLELGLASARTYPTPVGPGTRSSEQVREALSELRDPERRLLHEIWAQLDPPGREGDGDDRPAPPERADAPWPDALVAMGWAAVRARGAR